MTVAELIQHVGNLGFQLEPRPNGILAVIPASKLPAELADELRHHKTDIIRLLAEAVAMVPARKGWGAVPPEKLELVTFKPYPTPVNHDLITAYVSRQCVNGNRELRDWLTRRRAAYIGLTAGTWSASLITYAVARDAACWQLDRTEAEVWDLLEGIESCVEDLKSRSSRFV